jgi:hypothetical protein
VCQREVKVSRCERGKMMQKRLPVPSIALLMLLFGSSAYAQGTPVTTTGFSLADVLSELTRAASAGQVGVLGDLLRVSTALEIATMPLGTSSGGIVSKLDPTTGNEVPTATTFGPAFAQRALTAGAGKIAVSANLITATYDRLGSFDLSRMELSKSDSRFPELRQSGLMSLVLTTQSTVIHGVIGATEKFDIGADIPIVRVKVTGIGWTENAVVRQQQGGTVGPDIITRAEGAGVSSGLGDIAVSGKFRFLRFGATPPPDAPLEPDPGGLALLVTMRLPTGSRENLRGLGMTRAMGSLIVSSGKGRFRPHANVGYEWWEKAIDMASPGDPTIRLRHQFQFAVGAELEAAPKLTMLVDVLGRQVFGGGKLGFRTLTPADRPDFTARGLTSVTYARPTDVNMRELSIVPGLKWNLKGKMLLSVSGIATIFDDGLHDRFTPVVGLDFTF